MRLLCGVPLIGYTIRACQGASKLTHWVVSTEDKEIATIAESYGAAVVDQPMASDTSTSIEVCRYVLDFMESGNGKYDMVVLLHPTSPIRDPAHIDQAIELLANSSAQSLASVSCRKRTYFHNASLYAMKRDFVLTAKDHYSEESIPFLMDRAHSIDVDEEIDFAFAGAYLCQLRSATQ